MTILKRHFALVALGAAVALGALSIPGSSQEKARALKGFNLGASYLGIEMDEVTADNMAAHKLTAERGVIVRAVQKDSPAADATLQEKDVILDYDGMPVISVAQFSRLVQETPAGRKVSLGVSRDGKKLTLTARIGKREGPVLLRSDSGRWVPDVGRPFEFGGPDGGGQFGRNFSFGAPGGGNFFQFEVPEGASPRALLMPRFNRPALGVTLDGLTEQMGEYLGVPGKRGALITSVAEGTPAAAARLRAGDVVIAADDRPVDEPADIARAVDRRAGEKLQLKIVRDKKEISVEVELPKTGSGRPSSGYRL